MSNDNHRISIIVPVYRVEEYLDACVRSVINQSYDNWELILVDDGSPDRCGAICDAWAEKDSRIRVIHQKNGGLSAARNAGVKAARGDWLAFLDSDDWWEESFLSEMWEAVLTHQAELAICGWVSEYENDPDKKEHMLPEPGCLSSREALFLLCQTGGVVFVTAWNRLIRRDVWEGLFFPLGKLHEDEFVAYRLLDKACRIACLDRPLVHYRQRGGSITGRVRDLRHWDGTEALIGRYQFFEERGYEDLLDPAFECFKNSYFLQLLGLETESPEGKKRLKEICRMAAPLLQKKQHTKQLPAGEKLGLTHPLLWKKLHYLKNGGADRT